MMLYAYIFTKFRVIRIIYTNNNLFIFYLLINILKCIFSSRKTTDINYNLCPIILCFIISII